MFLNNLPSLTFWQQNLLSYSNPVTCILIRAVAGFRILQVPLFHATWVTNTFPFEFSHQQFHDYPKKGDGGDLSESCHEKLFHSDAVETELPGIAPSGRMFLLRWRDGEACVADKRSALGSDFCLGSEEMEGHCYHRLRSPQNCSSFASYMYCGTWFSIALGARTRGAEQVQMVENPPAFDSARRRGVGSRHLKPATCQFFTNCTRHRITQARSQNKPEHNARRREVPVQMQVNTRIQFNVSKGCTVASKEQQGKNA